MRTDVIEREHLSVIPVDPQPATTLPGEPMPAGSSLKEVAAAAAAQAEEQAIQWALHTTGGNKSEAARLLRTDYKTLYLKIKQYGIDVRQFREIRVG